MPDSNRKRDSGFLKLYAGLHKKKFPDSGIRIMIQEAKQVFSFAFC